MKLKTGKDYTLKINKEIIHAKLSSIDNEDHMLFFDVTDHEYHSSDIIIDFHPPLEKLDLFTGNVTKVIIKEGKHGKVTKTETVKKPKSITRKRSSKKSIKKRSFKKSIKKRSTKTDDYDDDDDEDIPMKKRSSKKRSTKKHASTKKRSVKRSSKNRSSKKRSTKKHSVKRSTKKRSVKRSTKKRSVKRSTKKRSTKKRSVKHSTKKRLNKKQSSKKRSNKKQSSKRSTKKQSSKKYSTKKLSKKRTKKISKKMVGGDNVPEYLKPLSPIKKAILLAEFYIHPKKYKIHKKLNKDKDIEYSVHGRNPTRS
jgi:hypothetical protein